MKIISNRKPDKKFIGWVHDGKLILNSDRAEMKSMCIMPDGKANVWSSVNHVKESSLYNSDTTYPIYEGDSVTLKF